MAIQTSVARRLLISESAPLKHPYTATKNHKVAISPRKMGCCFTLLSNHDVLFFRVACGGYINDVPHLGQVTRNVLVVLGIPSFCPQSLLGHTIVIRSLRFSVIR